MSSIGAIGTLGSSTFCLIERFRTRWAPGKRLAGLVSIDRLLNSTAGHGFQGELAKSLGLTGVDQVHHRGECRVAVGPEDNGRGQTGVRVKLSARGPQVQLYEVGLVPDGLDRLGKRLSFTADEQVAIAIDIEHEAIL